VRRIFTEKKRPWVGREKKNETDFFDVFPKNRLKTKQKRERMAGNFSRHRCSKTLHKKRTAASGGRCVKNARKRYNHLHRGGIMEKGTCPPNGLKGGLEQGQKSKPLGPTGELWGK